MLSCGGLPTIPGSLPGRGMSCRMPLNTDAPEAMLTGRLSIQKESMAVRRPAYFPASFFSALTISVFSQG